MKGRQTSVEYVKILQDSMLPIMKLNYQNCLTFQQDNCPIHVSAFTKKYMTKEGISQLNWPPHSPDLNIIENVWKILSDDVYSNGDIKNLSMLEKRIKDSVHRFNIERNEVVDNLYNSIPKRLISVIVKRGDRIKY